MPQRPRLSLNQHIRAYANSLKASLRLLKLVWHLDRKLVIGSSVAISIPGIVPFINAYIYAEIINFVVRHLQGSGQSYRHLYILIGLRIGMLFIQELAFILQDLMDRLLWTKLPPYFYELILSHISQLDLAYFEDSEARNRLERVRESIGWRPLNLMSSIFFSIQTILQVVIAAVSLVFLNWAFAILILVSTIPTLIYQFKFAELNWQIFEDNSPQRKRFWYLIDILQSSESVKELKLFGLSRYFLNELGALQAKYTAIQQKVLYSRLKYGVFAQLVTVVFYAVIEVFIIMRALTGRISVGSISYYTTVLTNYQNGLNGLLRNLSNVYEYSQYVGDMFDVLEAKPTLTSPENSVTLPANSIPKIEFKHVSFSYPNTTAKVFDDFSITIEAGQKVALVGENGAGKTTLIKLLARFYDVDEGEILIDGINIKQLDLTSWYDKLGVLFQDFLHYEYRLRDNIHFGRVQNANKLPAIIAAAAQSGADSVSDNLPKTYNQMLGKTFEEGIDLSGGQWQKVALARGFYRDANILILDEPTAAIDARAEAEIFERVQNLTRDRSVIIISHRFSTVRNADKIYVIDEGKIKEEGSHEELMKRNGTYAGLFNLQAKAYQ